MSETERVSAALQGKYDEIVALTDQFCQQHLNEEYRDLCRRMVAKLCRKRPSPVATGKTNTWACGIVYSVGRINFLFDKSQMPHIVRMSYASTLALARKQVRRNRRRLWSC
jgi:hypothetical protein